MDEFSTAFRDWMDDQKLAASDLCQDLNVSEQTIHNWRSAGVPARRQDQVRKLMAAWHLKREKPFGNSITVHITDQQFDIWNRAAMAEHKTIREWAVDGLDALAAEHYHEIPALPSDPSRIHYPSQDRSADPQLPYVLNEDPTPYDAAKDSAKNA
jgi:hypothetical protein